MNNRTLIIYSVAIILIFWSATGWQTADSRTSATTTQTIAPPMPNLDGEKAKRYLEQKGLDKSLGAAIQAARYGVNWIEYAPVSNQSGAFEAKNSQQEFAAYFTRDEVNLVSRGENEQWKFSLKLKGYGRGERIETVSDGEIKTDKNRIERTFGVPPLGGFPDASKSPPEGGTPNDLPQPAIVEWFENKPEGLEQSFVVNEFPVKDGQKTTGEKLKIVLNLNGDLQAQVAEDGQSLSLVKKSGAAVLRYDKLKSWDANGKELPSRMEASGDELSLVVDDENAVYPVTIDPTFTQVKKLLASDGAANDNFGNAVAISGNTIIVGAFGHTQATGFRGAAYIFERNTGGANNWNEVKKLTASDAANYDEFGDSVAIDGDTVIVGASYDDTGMNNEQGSVYIFERNAGGSNNWGQVKKLTANDGATYDFFGEAVSISGSTVIVGAPKYYAPGNNNPGAAYIFERNQGGANGWGQVEKIEAGDAMTSDEFGYSVCISGDTAIIGATGGAAAYIVERDAGGADNWGEVKKLTANDGASALFGINVAIDGDTAIVGAFLGIFGGEIQHGTAHIFERNTGGASNWGKVKRIIPSDGAPGDSFGISVAVSNDKIIVGASYDDTGMNNEQGSAYIFERNSGGANNWGQVKKLTASDGETNDVFGWDVAIEGNTTIVGARGQAINNHPARGEAYVFVRTNDSWNQEAKPLPANCTVEDYFGWSVAISGDTAIVGTPNDDVSSNANQGAAYIFQRDAGGANNWGLVKTIAATDGIEYDLFGWTVALEGNTAIVGTPYDDVGSNANQGAAYIFDRNSGGANNWGQVRKLTASDGADQDSFGWSVAVSGDTAIVGAIYDDVGTNNVQGSAYVFERNAGGANNWGEVKHVIASDGAVVDTFGKSVAISGDTAIVGSDGDDIGANGNQGSVYIFERNNGGANNWGEFKKILASDGAATDQFGYDVAIGGNTIIVGAWNDNVGANIDQGSAYIFERNTGGTNNWGEVKKLVAADGSAGDRFGISVSVSGDTAIVGTPVDQVGANTVQGSAYIFKQNTGGANNWGQVKKLVAADGAANDYFGSVAVSGDTAIVGASGDDVGGAVGQGSAYIFVSNSDAWNQQANVSPPPPTNCGAADNYGFSVAVSGDTAVIGAPGDDVGINTNQGSVYILERNQGGANNWGLVKLLTTSDGAANDYFGFSVAISGNSVIVGTYNDTIGTNTEQGSAYIFERNTGGTNNFGEVKKLTASDGTTADRFGWSVAINSNTAIVGATRDNADQGSAYIFERNQGGANNWGETKKLVDAGGATDDFFGWSVAVKNDTIFVSSPSDSVGANQNQGSAHIYERNAGGANNWARTKYLTVSDGAFFDNFGWAVAVSGNLLIVTATGDGIGEFTGEGSAYIFERNAGGAENWGQIKKIRAADAGQQDQFGRSVGISGDAAIVGTPLDDVGGNSNQGSAYIFEQNAGGANNWGQVNKLTALDGAANDWFGNAVAVSGDTFLVGAYLANAPAPFTEKQSDKLFGGNTKGAGYVFKGNALAPTAASVSVGGRVLTADGRGIANARVTLTDASGATRISRTNPFGYYRFTEVQAGETYIFSVSHKRYRFAPQVLSVTEEMNDLNFTAEN